MDLLDESIRYQIQNPFSSKTNFLEEFNDTYADDLNIFEGNDEETQETHSIALNFYRGILNLLDKRFDLQLDKEILEDMNVDGLKNLTEGLYDFFILKYANNIGKYITDMIIEHRDDLIDKYKNTDDDTVAWVSFSRKLKEPDMVCIFANLSSVIKEFRSMDITPDDFIQCFNRDKFEVAVLEYAIMNFLILGDFVPKFLGPLYQMERQDDIYDELIVTVYERLFNKYKKDQLPTIDEIKKLVVGDEEEDGE
jgi:hypothetical protein